MTISYLVTGGAGFIGSHFIKYLLATHDDIRVINLDALTYAGNLSNVAEAADDPRYRFIQADIADYEALSKVLADVRFDVVVNFAAESSVDRSITGPRRFIETNVTGVANLLACARSAWSVAEDRYRDGVRFLQISTDEVYGSNEVDPACDEARSLAGSPAGDAKVSERSSFFKETSALVPSSPYAASKAAADLLVQSFGRTYGIPFNITRSTNNYGTHQLAEKLIPRMIGCCLRHEPLPIYGDGRQVRDWLYVEDHCAALDAVLRNAPAGEIYNIAAHHEHDNLDVVRRIIARLHDRVDPTIDEGLIMHVQDRKAHDRRYGVDSEKIERDLKWAPRMGFREGLDVIIDWYVAHPAWLVPVASPIMHDDTKRRDNEIGYRREARSCSRT